MSLAVAVLGASGRMGRRVLQQVLDSEDLVLVAAVGRSASPTLGVDAGVLAGRERCDLPLTPIEAGFAAAQVVIDFALPEGTLAALPKLEGRALVTGTTGLSADPLDELGRYAQIGPLLHASNFSTGVNVLLALVRSAAAALPDYDIEIVEAHHSRKVDAPSGTALALAECAAGARSWDLDSVRQDGRVGRTGARAKEEIGIHALRAGGITGHHEVWIAGQSEQLRLVHSAGCSDVFAQGALRAARWIAGRPAGRYTMAQVLGL